MLKKKTIKKLDLSLISMSDDFGYIKDLVDMNQDTFKDGSHSRASWKGNTLSLTSTQKSTLLEGAKAIAKSLSMLHGIKPLTRKIWKAFKYTGKGDLSVLDILLTTLEHGKFELMERRKIKKNPQRPNVAICMDISASINNNKLTRMVMLIATTIAELFGNGFAKDFYCTTIGNGGVYEPAIMLRSDMEKVKRFIIDQQFADLTTIFLPSFQLLESSSFFSGKYGKYIFIITDGVTEINSQERVRTERARDIIRLNNQVKLHDDQLGPFIQSHWESRKDVQYFWIQIGKKHFVDELDFISTNLGYCPAEEEIGHAKYQLYNKLNSPSNIHYQMGIFLWESFKRKKFLYLPFSSFSDGSALPIFTDYVFSRYKSLFKS